MASMRIFIKSATSVFIAVAIFLFSARQLTADKYETVSISIHGKKLLGTGPHKKAVAGELLAYETSCCIKDFRKRDSFKILNQAEFKNNKEVPKSVTVRIKSKTLTFDVAPDALIFEDGRKLSSLGAATGYVAGWTPHELRWDIKDFYLDVYLLLDEQGKVRYVETFPVIGHVWNHKGKLFDKIKSHKFLIVQNMDLYPVKDDPPKKLKKTKENLKKVKKSVANKAYKIYLEKDCIINKNYQPSSLATLDSAFRAIILFNHYGKAKRIDAFVGGYDKCSVSISDKENSQKILGEYGKDAYISERTKIFWYGWELNYDEYKRISETTCCSHWTTLCKDTHEVKSVVIISDD